MVGNPAAADDAAFPDDVPEQTRPDWQMGDRGALLGRETGRVEGGHASVPVQDPERGVARMEELARDLDDSLEQVGEGELARQGDVAEGPQVPPQEAVLRPKPGELLGRFTLDVAHRSLPPEGL